MKLNPDIYNDVAREVLRAEDNILESTTKFMFTGKESLIILEKLMKEVKACKLDYYGVQFYWVSI